MKKNAIISTLLDRHTTVIEALFREYEFDLITPRHFLETQKRTTLKTNSNIHVIEDQLDDNEIQKTKEESVEKNKRLDENEFKIKEYLKNTNQLEGISSYIKECAKNRTEKIITLFEGLNKLKEKFNIRCLLLNQEYMIHEATLVQWAKYNKIPIIHLCHGALIGRNPSLIRHYISDHITLAKKQCSEIYNDMNTGKGQHHLTGMVSWDIYRTINQEEIITLKEKLKIPKKAIIITFYPTFASSDNSTSDMQVYENTLNAFMEAAGKINQESNKELFFIVKDRPSGSEFSQQQALHKAKKLGLKKCFAYIFERSEKIVILSDINISPNSSISVESMAMGKATINLIERISFLMGIAFAANSGVAQCDTKNLYITLKNLIEKNNERKKLVAISSKNMDYIYPTIKLNATQLATAKVLDIINEPILANKVLADKNFYNDLDLNIEDQRFFVNDAFQIWQSKTQPDELTGQLMGERYNTWKTQPTFHLLIIVDESLFSALATTLDSFELQIYKHYGISILSTAVCPIENIDKQANIQWIQTSTPFEDINQIIEQVNTDWIMQLWPGDELHPQALFNIADYADLNNDWLAIYGDEVLVKLTEKDLDDNESRLGTSLPEDPAFKPDFNLDLLRSTDYVNRAVAFRKDAWQALKGFQPFAYRQNEDLVFRLAERMTLPAIGHIPSILVNRSPYTKELIESENYDVLGAIIRQQHLTRCDYHLATVQPGLYQGTYNTQYNLPVISKTVNLLMASHALDDNLANCLRSYLENTHSNSVGVTGIQLYLGVPNNTLELDTWLEKEKLSFTHQPKPFLVQLENWQGVLAAWQELIAASDSEVIVLALNNLRFVQKNWLNPLLDQLNRPDVAMSGPRLVSTNATILSAGQILGKNGLVGDLYENFFLEQEVNGLPRAWCEQNFYALNPACLAVKRSKLLAEGGLSTDFSSLLAVNDLQIKLCVAGSKLVWSPLSSVALVDSNHYQISATDNALFKEKWFDLLTSDPAFNPNLALRTSGLDADTLLAGKWHHQLHQRPRILITISDPSTKQIELSKALTNHLNSKDLQETLQIQSYGHLSGSETAAINAIEIARLGPNLCIYSGKPQAMTAAIQDLAKYTQIQQWIIVSSKLDVDQWQDLNPSLNGWLVTDKKLFDSLESLPTHLSKVLLTADTIELDKPSEPTILCSKAIELWVKQLFNLN